MTNEEAIQVLQTALTAPFIYGNYADAIGMAIEALKDRPQGEWKHTIAMQPYCSNCEYVFGEDEEFSPFWNYCPMCGARIKGGDTE